MKSSVAEAIHASSLANASTVPSAGVLLESGSRVINAVYTAGSALCRERITRSSSGGDVAPPSGLLGLGCVCLVER